MLLNSRRWGDAGNAGVVCVHGLTQHGGVFEALGRRLAAAGHAVVAVDLRAHGESSPLPPWNIETHVDDLLETADALGLDRPAWIGHSFGGRLVATLAAREPRRARALALLEPGLEVPPARALQAAETERLDWSFASIEGAVQAILSSPSTLAPPRQVVEDYVRGDVRTGADGRFRFRFSPAAAVVAWSEMTRPAPPIAACPTLVVRAEASHTAPTVRERYEAALGELLTVVEVPGGHNVLWESPLQTLAALEGFLGDPARRPVQADRV